MNRGGLLLFNCHSAGTARRNYAVPAVLRQVKDRLEVAGGCGPVVGMIEVGNGYTRSIPGEVEREPTLNLRKEG